MQERVVVTGAGGFLGSHFCEHFTSRDYLVAGVDQCFPVDEGNDVYRGVRKMCRMVLPGDGFVDLLREFKPTLVLHSAGASSISGSMKDPYGDYQSNVQVTAFVLECMRTEVPQSMCVLLSSAAVYGNPDSLPVSEKMPWNPISPYGYHKLMCELLAQEFSIIYGIPIAVVRVFSAYGERLQRQVIFDLCTKLTTPDDRIVEVYGTGNETRDFIHAIDVARAIECIHASRATGVFNVASGAQTTIAELVQMIRKNFKSTKAVHYTGSVRQGDPLCWQGEIRKIASLGFQQTVPLDKGIHDYCQWFESELKGG
jgi:UDP-glucose 4-epimerase